MHFGLDKNKSILPTWSIIFGIHLHELIQVSSARVSYRTHNTFLNHLICQEISCFMGEIKKSIWPTWSWIRLHNLWYIAPWMDTCLLTIATNWLAHDAPVLPVCDSNDFTARQVLQKLPRIMSTTYKSRNFCSEFNFTGIDTEIGYKKGNL